MTATWWNVLRWGGTAIVAIAAASTALHALLHKRDSQAALGWIAVCLLFPLAGPVLYVLFGINRIQTRARQYHEDAPERTAAPGTPAPAAALPEEYRPLVRIANAVTARPLLTGNRVEALRNGEGAYPPMLEAIHGARRRLFLATYLFETDSVGRDFVAALAAAAGRGVEVRVLIDGIGELYSWPRAGRLLERAGVPVARFLPPRLVPPALHVNLRNHRKLLIADDEVGFTGGMNLGGRHLVDRAGPGRVSDMHFRVGGPVVAQMEQVFLDDWAFCTGEVLVPAVSPTGSQGRAICRTIVDGPNEDLDKLASVLDGAASSARRRLAIVTPYFIPSRELRAALRAAALRGVDVSVILPARSNLPVVHWASRNMLWDLLLRGVRVYYQPPPFAHTKLFLVDDAYVILGSANIDPRSLRLNFELALEVFDPGLATDLWRNVEEIRGRSREVTIEEVDGRALPVRVRDSLAWLFSPYL